MTSETKPALTSFERFYFNKGRGPSAWADDARSWSSEIETLLTLGQYSGALATLRNAKCQTIFDSCDVARSAISWFRLGFQLEEVFSGKAFWKTTVDEKTGIKRWERDANGNFVTRDWKDVATSVMITAGRVLSVLLWLHSLNVINLGGMTKGMVSTAYGIWTAVIGLGLIRGVTSLPDSENREAAKKQLISSFGDALSLISLPLDFGFGAIPVATRSAICISSSVVCLGTSAWHYKG